MQTIPKWITGCNTEQLVGKTSKPFLVVSSMIAIITIFLGPTCYTLGYLTALTAVPSRPFPNALRDDVQKLGTDLRGDSQARPTDSIDALVQNSNVTYILRNPCGQTVVEAKAHGCHHDMVEMAWVPKECYDPELEEELRAIRDWQFFRFMNRTGEISWDDARTGDFEFLIADWDCKLRLPVFRCTEWISS